MVTVIGVRFRTAGKIYYFSPGKLEIKNGDHVIVETARGIEYGHVVLGNRDVEDNKVVQQMCIRDRFKSVQMLWVFPELMRF